MPILRGEDAPLGCIALLDGSSGDDADGQGFDHDDEQLLVYFASLAAVAVLLLVLGVASQLHARRDRALAAELETRVKTLTLRATTAAQALRVAPNPRSWSAAAWALP